MLAQAQLASDRLSSRGSHQGLLSHLQSRGAGAGHRHPRHPELAAAQVQVQVFEGVQAPLQRARLQQPTLPSKLLVCVHLSCGCG